MTANKRIKLARLSADVTIRYRRARRLSAVRWADEETRDPAAEGGDR